jgi:hypothetical protein
MAGEAGDQPNPAEPDSAFECDDDSDAGSDCVKEDITQEIFGPEHVPDIMEKVSTAPSSAYVEEEETPKGDNQTEHTFTPWTRVSTNGPITIGWNNVDRAMLKKLQEQCKFIFKRMDNLETQEFTSKEDRDLPDRIKCFNCFA